VEFQDVCEQLQQKRRLILDDLLSHPVYGLQFTSIQQQTQAQYARQVLFHAISGNCDQPRCHCGKTLAWHPDQRCYRKFCSTRCQVQGNTEIRKATCLERYGVEFPSQRAEFAQLVTATNRKKWGVDYYAQTAECQERIKQTNLQNLGCERPAQNPVILSKTQRTVQHRYGVDNPAQSADVQQQIRHTTQSRYGVDHVMQLDSTKQKLQDTCRKKYGVAHPNQIPGRAQQLAQDRLKKYYPTDTWQKLQDSDWLALQNQQGKTVGTIAAELGVSASGLNKYFHKHQIDIQHHYTSQIEKQLSDHFANIGVRVVTRDRSIIAPRELDLVFPDFQLAIEINGGYYHSEQFQKNPKYHLEKTLAAGSAGYELWHFWDWELMQAPEKIIHKIQHRLGMDQRIYARTLNIVQITAAKKKEFFSQYHLQSDCVSSVNLALTDDQGQILMAASFGTSRFTKKYQWELLRLCSRGGVTVVGGASRLITYFVNQYLLPGQTVVSYCNRRWSQGAVYERSGFTPAGQSPPSYVYVHRGKFAGTRYQFQKHRLKDLLKNFQSEISEADNMEQNEYYRAWDCGQLIYTLTKPML
jgi:very-short-patch-repair endonuclease